MNLLNLPSEIQISIFNYLPSIEVIKLFLVSKSMVLLLKEISFGLKIDLKNKKITDAGLSYLKGIHTINLGYCEQITDAGLVHLKGANIYI